MLRNKTTLLIAAVPLVLLSGCVTRSESKSPSVPVAEKKAIERVCPTPTNRTAKEKILDYLVSSPQSEGLDTLAEEWERLDSGAKVCRGAGA